MLGRGDRVHPQKGGKSAGLKSPATLRMRNGRDNFTLFPAKTPAMPLATVQVCAAGRELFNRATPNGAHPWGPGHCGTRVSFQWKKHPCQSEEAHQDEEVSGVLLHSSRRIDR